MRHLLPFQYVEAIARMGSIRKAAEGMAITPSALNRRLLSMEEELGVAIFERLHNGVRLSTAGEILLEHIRARNADMERVKSRIADLSGMRRGNVSIAATAECVTEFLAKQVSVYRAEFPDVRFVVDHLPRGAAETALVEHSADIAMVFEPLKLAEFQTVCRVSQPLMCVFEKTHPLAGNKEVRLYDCAEFPLALPQEGSGLRGILDAAATKHGIEIKAAIQSNSPEFVHRSSQLPGHISFDISLNVPDDLDQQGLTARPIDSRDVSDGFLFLGHLKSRALPVASARFLEQLSGELSKRFG